MRTGLWAVICAAALAAALAASAGAQKPDQKDLAKANKHYQLAEKAAADKRWKDAAREYGIAYEHSRDPVLFFKLAGAYQSAGDCGSALIYYKRYLAEAKPNEQFKKLTEERIAECEASGATGDTGDTGDTGATDTGATDTGDTGATDTGDTGPTDTGDTAGDSGTLSPFDGEDDPPIPTDTTPTSDPSVGGEPSWQRTAAWISVGIAVAFGTTGGVLGLAAGSREDDIQAQIDFRDPTSQAPARFEGNAAVRYDDLVEQGKRFELLSLVSFAAAGAAVGAAVVFFILDPGPEAADGSAASGSPGPMLAPAVGPDTIGVSAGWRFD
jgi:hypothetical protein